MSQGRGKGEWDESKRKTGVEGDVLALFHLLGSWEFG